MHAHLESLQRSDIGFAFSVHASTVSRWVSRDGCPRNPDGSYSLKDVITWFLDRNDLETEAVNESKESQKWLGEFRKERALMVRLERKEMEGGLISKKQSEEKWAQRMAAMFSGLDLFENRLPPVLVGKTERKIAEILGKAVWEMRSVYSGERVDDKKDRKAK